jgi:hypothetical protein
LMSCTRPARSTGPKRPPTARTSGPKGRRIDRPVAGRSLPLGQQHHVICCANGIPLALTVTASNRNDITQLLKLVDRIAPVGPHGKFRPKVLLADRADTASSRICQQRALTSRCQRSASLDVMFLSA